MISEHIDAYLCSQSDRRFSEKTLDSRRFALLKFVRFMESAGIERVQDVTSDDMDRYCGYLNDAGMSDSTTGQYMGCLRLFLSHLESIGIIFINPAAELVVPRAGRKLQPVPNEDQMKMLLSAPNTTTLTGIRDRALIEIAYGTAARLGEIVAMDVTDLNLAQGTAKLHGKGSKERMVPLGSETVKWIEDYISNARRSLLRGNINDPALWLGHWGRRIHPIIVQQMIREHGEQAGIEMRLTPHSLRRACATHMLRNGAHPVQIQLLLGHKSLRTLSQYLKVTITDLKKMHERSKPGQ